MNIAVILPAAGSGTRFGASKPKQFLELRALPILIRSISLFTQMQEIGPILVAVSPEMLAEAEELIEEYHPRRVSVLEGGTERQHSIAQCLQHPTIKNCDLVMVHDAVRPLCSPQLVRSLIAEARVHGACVPGIAVVDTTKEIDDNGFVVRTHAREHLRSIQTPQVFQRKLLVDAYEYVRTNNILTTDDASVVESFGGKVKVIDGDPRNIKITTQQDWDLAERYIDAGIAEAINLRHM